MLLAAADAVNPLTDSERNNDNDFPETGEF